MPPQGKASAPFILSALALGAGSFLFALSAPWTSRPEAGPLRGKIDEYLSRLEGYGFSGAVLVARNDQVLLQKGYGFADRARGVAATPDTVFSVGSVTKQFTGAAILKLEMQGKLKVEDPLSKFIPGVPPDKAGITLHHLLTHSSGLESGFGDDFEEVSREELVRRALASELRSPPGALYHYSNAGFSLLAAVVEIVSAGPYEAFLRENLFGPAGMRRTGSVLPKWSPDELARGYLRGKDWGTFLDRWPPSGPYWNQLGNGGILSTLPDMYRWHLALQGDTVLSKEEREKYFAPHVREGEGARSFYGYGWAIFTTTRGTRLIAHNGGNGILTADFLRFVDEGAVIIAFGNSSEFRAYQLGPQLERILFGGEIELPPRVLSVGAEILPRYAGSYPLPNGAQIRVSVEKDHLGLLAEGQEAVDLLNGSPPDFSSRAEELNARTAALLELKVRGEYGPLHAALGRRVPLERFTAAQRERREATQRELGPYRGFKVLGTAPAEEGSAITTVRLDLERGARFLEYVWEESSLLGERSLSAEPSRAFYPVEEGEFVFLQMEPPRRTRIKFEAGADGRPTLVAGEAARARRIPIAR